MNDWDRPDRRLGPKEHQPAETPAEQIGTPSDVPTPLQVQGPASEPPRFEPLRLEPEQTALVPVPEVPEEEGWTLEDEFNPRYCVVCHKKIPHRVSEVQEMCNACFSKRGQVIPLPVSGEPIGAPMSPVVRCPMCGGTEVEREWKNDWVSTAVDIVSDAMSFGAMIIGGFSRYSDPRSFAPNLEVGHVKMMRHRCLSCKHIWVE